MPMKKIKTASSLFADRQAIISDTLDQFPVGVFLSQVNRNSTRQASFGVDIPQAKLPNVQADITLDLQGSALLTVYDDSKEGTAAVYHKKERPSASKKILYDRLQTFIADLRNGRLSSALKGFDRVN